ncbi:MAG TPA: aminopeptidase [Caldilineae bacterium]|nr:aminopeptidase [Caldilineae bacterium]
MILVERKEIEDAVLKMLQVNMGLRAGERLLVVADVPTLEQWSAQDQPFLTAMTRRALLAKTVAEIAHERMPAVQVDFLPFPSTGRSGAEPPADVAERMRGADVVVIISSFSLSHTDAREEACRAGARIASMPRFIPEMFYPSGPMDVDYHQVEQLTQRLAEALTPASQVHVTCPAGTDITFSIEGRPGQVDAGMYTQPGTWGNLPAGEAYCVPLEGTAEGVIYVTPGWYAGLTEPMILTFAKGELVELRGGGAVGDQLRELLRPGEQSEPYKSRRNLGEFGIGTNPNAKRIDITLEAEKIMGTVHLAVGDNAHMGGQVSTDYHQDFVIPKATFTLDGEVVMREGKIVLRSA